MPEAPDSAKANPDYEVEPWYWVPEDETALRVARLPSRLKQYFRKENGQGCLRVLAEWVLGTLDPESLRHDGLARAAPAAEARLRDVLGVRALERNILQAPLASWLGKAAPNARKMQRETPLNEDDLVFIREAPSDPLELTGALIGRKQPRWLMGWRDITNATNERTVIASVFPKVASGDKLLIMHHTHGMQTALPIIAILISPILDYVARQKFGGTSFKYYYIKQLPVPSPSQLSTTDTAYLAPRVLGTDLHILFHATVGRGPGAHWSSLCFRPRSPGKTARRARCLLCPQVRPESGRTQVHSGSPQIFTEKVTPRKPFAASSAMR